MTHKSGVVLTCSPTHLVQSYIEQTHDFECMNPTILF